jgi:hypothetical protein
MLEEEEVLANPADFAEYFNYTEDHRERTEIHREII